MINFRTFKNNADNSSIHNSTSGSDIIKRFSKVKDFNFLIHVIINCSKQEIFYNSNCFTKLR